MNYKIGLIQFKPELFNKTKNLEKIEQLICNMDADLIVLPELAISGYIFANKEELCAVAEDPITGKTSNLMRRLSKERDVSLVIGFAEKSGDKIYNSAILSNPDGTEYIYRKTHLFDNEKSYFTPGNSGFQVVSAKNGVKVGLMICFDWQFPESARTLALRGAQVLCHPANLVLPWCQQAMITRSLENRVFSITANRLGLEKNGDTELYFTGMSQILDTKGNILCRLSEDNEETTVVIIDPTFADQKQVTPNNNVFSDRRPDYYQLD